MSKSSCSAHRLYYGVVPSCAEGKQDNAMCKLLGMMHCTSSVVCRLRTATLSRTSL